MIDLSPIGHINRTHAYPGTRRGNNPCFGIFFTTVSEALERVFNSYSRQNRDSVPTTFARMDTVVSQLCEMVMGKLIFRHFCFLYQKDIRTRVLKPFIDSLYPGIETINIPCRDTHIQNLAPASLHNGEEGIIGNNSFVRLRRSHNSKPIRSFRAI